jgi:uncharacterized protein (TIGR02246 family)
MAYQGKGRRVMRASWKILVIVATGCAVSAPAHSADPSVRQPVEQIAAAFEAHFDKQDAAGCASLFTPDGVLVSPGPTIVKAGPQEIAQNYQGLFKSGANHLEVRVDQVSRLGTNAVIAMGESHVTGQSQTGAIKNDFHWTAVDVRNGSTWKIRLLTIVPNPPPTGSASAATPSGSAK